MATPSGKYKCPDVSYAIWHRENGPAVINYDQKCVRFFLHGTSVKIEDLPCDDETKVLLALKYDYKGPKESQATKVGWHNYVM